MTHSGYFRAALLSENVVPWIARITMNVRFVLAIGLIFIAAPVSSQQSTNHTMTIRVRRSIGFNIEMTTPHESGEPGMFSDRNESAIKLTVSRIWDGRSKKVAWNQRVFIQTAIKKNSIPMLSVFFDKPAREVVSSIQNRKGTCFRDILIGRDPDDEKAQVIIYTLTDR